MDDYYAILEVSCDATTQEITRSYKRLALRLHPDKNPSSDSTEAFQKLVRAYDELKDDRKRQIYDASQSWTRAREQEARRRRRRDERREQLRREAARQHTTNQGGLRLEQLRVDIVRLEHLRAANRQETMLREAARRAEALRQDTTSQGATRQNAAHHEAEGQEQAAQSPDLSDPQGATAFSNGQQENQPEQRDNFIPLRLDQPNSPNLDGFNSDPPHYSSHSFAQTSPPNHRTRSSNPPDYRPHNSNRPEEPTPRNIGQRMTPLEASIQFQEERIRAREEAERASRERLPRIRAWKSEKSRHYFARLRTYTAKKGVIANQLNHFQQLTQVKQTELMNWDKKIEDLKGRMKKDAHILDILKLTNWCFRKKMDKHPEYAELAEKRSEVLNRIDELKRRVDSCHHEMERERLAYEQEEHSQRAVAVREVRSYLTLPVTEQNSKPGSCQTAWRALGEVEMPANFFLRKNGAGACEGVWHDMVSSTKRKLLSFRSARCGKCNKPVRGRENYTPMWIVKSAMCSKCNLMVCGMCAKWMLALKEYEQYLGGQLQDCLFDFEDC
jgi:curved DNA-binding protein CbpA